MNVIATESPITGFSYFRNNNEVTIKNHTETQIKLYKSEEI